MKTALAFLLALPLVAQLGAGASLDGHVVNAITGETIPAARVRIRPIAGGLRLATVSDAAGSFHFDGLAPGRYGLQIEHANYVRGLGRGRSTAFQTTVDVVAGEKQRDLIVRIMPTGSIEGVVTADSGEPVDQCNVELLQSEYRQGRRALAVHDSGTTDGRGYFRITDVAPGVYRIRARCAPNPVPFRPLLPDDADFAGPSLGFVPTLRSELVTVESGLPTRGIEIRVRESTLYPVNGTATMPLDARSAAFVQIALVPENADEGAAAAAVATPANPAFRIAAALPGRYSLVAIAQGGEAFYTARQAITVSNDTPAVALTLAAGISVNGTIEIQSGGDPPGLGRSGILVPEDSAIFGARNFASSDAGDFVIRGVAPGIWRLLLPAPGPDFYLRSIMSGNRALNSLELPIADAGPLRLIYSGGAGSIDGMIQEPSGAPRPPDRTVVLQPLFTPSFFNPEDLLATADADGRFHIGGLVPNRYRLYTLPGLDADVALDPELLRALEAYADIVTVESGKPTLVTGKAAPDAVVFSALSRL